MTTDTQDLEQLQNEINRLGHELNRVTRGDVSNIITTLGDALTYIGQLEERIRRLTNPECPYSGTGMHVLTDTKKGTYCLMCGKPNNGTK